MGVYGKTGIPALREYMEPVKDLSLITNIARKTNIYDYEGLPGMVYEMIREYGLRVRVIGSGFNRYRIMKMKSL